MLPQLDAPPKVKINENNHKIVLKNFSFFYSFFNAFSC